MQPHSNTQEKPGAPRFKLGQTVMTPGAKYALENAGQTPNDFLRRHMAGDWGDLSDDDVKQNDFSLQQGLKLLSCYHTAKSEPIWIISEADRSATTILLPREY